MSSGISTTGISTAVSGSFRRLTANVGPFRLVWRWSHLLILVIPVLLVCLPFWPGHMNADTLNEITEVITGNLTDWHAPMLLGIWHLFWGIGVGPGWVLGAQVCCFVLGAYLVVRSVFGRFGAALAATVLTLVPQDYGQLGLIGRDTWYTALLLLSVGALAWGFAWDAPRTRRRKVVSIVISLGAAWLALAARQNAVTSMPVIFGAGIALVFQVTRWRDPVSNIWGRIRRLAVVVIGALVVTLGMYVSQSVLADVIGVQRVHPEQGIYEYDLTGMSIRENRDLFPHSILPPNRLGALKQYFYVDDVTPEVVAGPLPRTQLNADQVSLERSAEIRAVKHAPWTWFRLRWDEFTDQIALTTAASVVIHPGIDPNPFGLHASFPRLDKVARAYVEAFDQTNVPEPNGGIVFAPWIYLLIALVGVFSLRRWREPRWLLVGALALSSLSYQVGVFLSMFVGYRLEYPSVVTGLLALVVGGRILWGRRRASSKPNLRSARVGPGMVAGVQPAARARSKVGRQRCGARENGSNT